ncbi:MAG: methyltransferase domain-containing protein [Deltaproteobacteria bacterium]|nr:methyltransferase domain-containing protein [Deltaproteobacteria bacterium]
MTRGNYDLKRHTELLGKVAIEIETLADLDATINKLCEGVDPKAAEAVFVEDLCPYFGVVWPAARAVSEHLARMGTWLAGKTVLELGCGLALPSLVAAKLGAKVIATDFHPDVPKFLSRNLNHNLLTAANVEYRAYDWRKESTLGTFDFVVGSDILYEASHPKDVARSLAAHCARGSHIILGDPGRVYLQRCLDAICALGFQSDIFIKEVSDSHSDRAGDRKTKEVFVISLQKKT